MQRACSTELRSYEITAHGACDSTLSLCMCARETRWRRETERDKGLRDTRRQRRERQRSSVEKVRDTGERVAVWRVATQVSDAEGQTCAVSRSARASSAPSSRTQLGGSELAVLCHLGPGSHGGPTRQRPAARRADRESPGRISCGILKKPQCPPRIRRARRDEPRGPAPVRGYTLHKHT